MDINKITIIIGLILSALYAVLIICSWKKRQKQYDERQLAVQAEAFRAAMITVVAVYAALIICSIFIREFYLYGLLFFTAAVFAGMTVFFLIAILRDAYILPADLERKPLFFRWGVLYSLFLLQNAYRAVTGIARGELTLQDAPGSELWLYLIAGIAAVIIYTCFFVKLFIMKRELKQ